jgi:hypothetical protein
MVRDNPVTVPKVRSDGRTDLCPLAGPALEQEIVAGATYLHETVTLFQNTAEFGGRLRRST